MKQIFYTITLAFLVMSCNNASKPVKSSEEGKDSMMVTKKGTEMPTDSTVMAMDDAQIMGNILFEKDGLKIYESKTISEFSDASLKLESIKKNETNHTIFNFGIKNYELTAQTSDAHTEHCANSKKGQHIHLILNGGAYFAYYKTSVDTLLDAGNYQGIAFLSRSYHESIKNGKAFQLVNFTKTASGLVMNPNTTKPSLFYSRPKGEYKGKDVEFILLDFFLSNTTLSKDGMKVRASIDGTEFLITKWQPLIIKGLALGKHKIKLELMDKNGKLVEGPNNKSEKEISLLQQ